MIKTLFSNFLTRSGEISYTKRHLRHSAANSFNFVKFDLLCFMDHEFVENNIKQKHPTIPNPNLGNISICGLNCVSQFKEYPGSSFCPAATLPSSASFVTRAQIPNKIALPTLLRFALGSKFTLTPQQGPVLLLSRPANKSSYIHIIKKYTK